MGEVAVDQILTPGAHRTLTLWRRIDLMHGADHRKRGERRDRGSNEHHRHHGKTPPHLHTYTHHHHTSLARFKNLLVC